MKTALISMVDVNLATAFRTVSSTGTYTSTATLAGDTSHASGLIATFK